MTAYIIYIIAGILTTHDIKGVISERQASGGAIKGLIFCVAKVSADVTFWSGDSCRCAEFFPRPADSAGPFFAHCFTIYRGCLREFLRVRAAAETLFAGVVVAAAACTHSARNADVYVPGKVHGLLSALFVSTTWRHGERNSAFFPPTGPINCSLALPPHEQKCLNSPENLNSRSHNNGDCSFLIHCYFLPQSEWQIFTNLLVLPLKVFLEQELLPYLQRPNMNWNLQW